MNISNSSTTHIVRMQRLGAVLAPPVITGLCLLIGFDLISTAMVAFATAFPASLYSRRLTASTEKSHSYEQEEEAAKILQDRKNIVVYKTAEGPQIIGFYKILQRPPGYAFHTLRAKFAQSDLTIYPMIHANGLFLAFRLCDNGPQSQKYLILEAPQHLETFAQTLMQKLPGLAIEPASFTDVKSLIRIFGLKSVETSKGSSEIINRPSSCSFESINRLTQDPDFLEKILKKKLRKSERKVPENKRASNNLLREFGDSSTSPESRLDISNKNIYPVMSGKKALATLTDTYQQILATIESVQGDANAVPVTFTVKRIAGRLVLKDLIEVLNICQTLTGLPLEIQNLMNAFQAYYKHYFGDLTAKTIPIRTEELWEHIPGAAVIVGMLVEKLGASQLTAQPQWAELSLRA
ncbi:MAG: hypothetical protein ACFFB3_00380 [Candidatus Hodarchaeota archaeon]